MADVSQVKLPLIEYHWTRNSQLACLCRHLNWQPFVTYSFSSAENVSFYVGYLFLLFIYLFIFFNFFFFGGGGGGVYI